jgi:hypothetical protein
MSFTAAALVVGVLLGLITGGRPSNLGRRPVELVWLVAVSAALQVAAESLDVSSSLGLAMVLTSYVGLSAFAVANIRLIGMPVVLIGLLANLTVISLNAGMPVRAKAILAAHASTPAEIDEIDFGAKRHLATDDDTLVVIGDIIPVRPTREVLSFGDLVLAFGVADVLFRLLRPLESRRRQHEPDHGEAPASPITSARRATLVDA